MKDPDFKELDDRCRNDCKPTVPLTNDKISFDYACVAWDKKSRRPINPINPFIANNTGPVPPEITILPAEEEERIYQFN